MLRVTLLLSMGLVLLVGEGSVSVLFPGASCITGAALAQDGDDQGQDGDDQGEDFDVPNGGTFDITIDITCERGPGGSIDGSASISVDASVSGPCTLNFTIICNTPAGVVTTPGGAFTVPAGFNGTVPFSAPGPFPAGEPCVVVATLFCPGAVPRVATCTVV